MILSLEDDRLVAVVSPTTDHQLVFHQENAIVCLTHRVPDVVRQDHKLLAALAPMRGPATETETGKGIAFVILTRYNEPLVFLDLGEATEVALDLGQPIHFCRIGRGSPP